MTKTTKWNSTTTIRRRFRSDSKWAADPESITGEGLLTFVNDDLFPTLSELQSADDDQRLFFIPEIFIINRRLGEIMLDPACGTGRLLTADAGSIAGGVWVS